RRRRLLPVPRTRRAPRRAARLRRPRPRADRGSGEGPRGPHGARTPAKLPNRAALISDPLDARTMAIKCMSRPAVILDGAAELAAEFSPARWPDRRRLDFEDEHQRLLDDVADQCAPGLRRVARLLAILGRRQRRTERASAGSWKPRERPELVASLRARLAALRAQRDADPRWREALLWADGVDPDAPDRGKPRRKSGETDEEFAQRCATRRTKLTRREAYRAALYAERRVYWGTWNALLASVETARKAVLKQRKAGVAASWKRPRWDDPCTIS